MSTAELSRERDAASACLHKVDVAFKRIIKARKEKNDGAVNMLTMIKKIH